MKALIEQIAPFLILGIMISLAITIFMFLSRVLLIGLIVGFSLFVLDILIDKFQNNNNSNSGRITDQR
jgi:hypothetical protein